MVQKYLLLLFIASFFLLFLFDFEETNKITEVAILTAKVTSTFEIQSTPLSNARIIVLNSAGDLIGTELSNSEGEAKIPVTVPKDPRFPMKNMGIVTVIAVANGYNEYINFSVPINESYDNSGKVFIQLWKIDPKRRNEPHFLNGNFHRFTVFEFLDYHAEKIGLKRQEITFDIGKEPPWSYELTVN